MAGLPALAGWVAAGVSAALAGLGGAWWTSAGSRARRAARSALRPVRREVRRYRKARARHEAVARAPARAWAAERARARRRGVPVEALREAGAHNVRWAALREAGWTHLDDVAGRSARELTAVHGIGKTTARRIAEAASAVAGRVDAEPPDLPGPDLAEPGARPLAAAALHLVDAGEAAGDGPESLAGRVDALETRVRAVARSTGWGAWVGSLFARGRRARAVEEAEAVARDARVLAGDEALREAARAGRARLAALPRPRRLARRAEAPDLAARWQDRFAACCAVLDQVFDRLGPTGSGDPVRRRQGGLPAEIARRVESQPLDTSRLRATLRRYQDFGARYLLAQERTILGDEMGLGKTLQALAVMAHLQARSEGRHFAVVAPAGLLVNWEREIRRHTALPSHRLHGEQAVSRLAAWAREGGVAITSYATLRSLDVGGALERVGGTLDLAVVDEAHYAKNPAAGRTQAVRRLAARSRRVCLMSGTPMENEPGELLALVEAVDPEQGRLLATAGLHLDAAAGSVRRFHEAVAPVYLRRNQPDVLTELPDRIEVDEWVEASPPERAVYDEAVRAGRFMAMRRLTTLGAGGGRSAKLDHLDELLEDHRASGRKVIVFSFFLDVLDAVASRFGAVGIVSGARPPDERQALVDALATVDGHALLALQIQAGGQGLNIQSASVVVIMEPQVKPSLEEQAVARAHRMGQTERVLVHRLLMRDSCDETMLALVGGKRELFDRFARRSLVKEASAQATETAIARAVVAAEQDRLARERTPATGPAP